MIQVERTVFELDASNAFPASARDREMRAAILSGAAESGQDGFAPLAGQPGVGVRLDEEAAGRYAEETL